MKRLLSKIGYSIHNHAKLTVSIIALLTIIFGLGLSRIQMNTGNSMFVSSNSKISKDSATYQKQFGNDVFIIDIQNKDGSTTVTPGMLKKVSNFTKQADNIKGIKSTADIASVLNGELDSSSVSQVSGKPANSSAKLQTAVMAELSSQQKQKIQKQISQSLSKTQQKQLSDYTLSILSDSQKIKIAQLQGDSSKRKVGLTKMLSSDQQVKIQNYTQKILTKSQKQSVATATLKMMPSVQNMNPQLLRQLVYSDNGKIPSTMEQLLPDNGKHLLVTLTTTAHSNMNTNSIQYKKIGKTLKDVGLSSGKYQARIAGAPAITGTVGKQMTNSMSIMLVAAVIIMCIILLLVFPVRRRLLPLVFVLVGMVWTFGLMGWLKIDLTMATMATLPIIIGLGTDFGVQFLNRYEEEFKKNGQNSINAVTNTAGHSGMAVGIASIVMILSFLTMLISKAPMLRFFGVTLAIGVLMSYIVEFALTFATVSLLDGRKDMTKVSKIKLGESQTWLNTVLVKYSKWVMKHAGLITIIGVLLGGIGFFFESHISIETDLTKMIPQDLPALKANKKVIKEIGSTTNLTYLVKSDDVRSKDNLDAANQFGKHVQSKYGHDILEVTSLPKTLNYSRKNNSQAQLNSTIEQLPDVVRKTLISKNHQYATVTFKINPDLNSNQALKLMNKITKDANNVSGDLTVSPAGSTSMALKGVKNMTANRELITIAGLVTIFVVLMLVYRHFHYAIYPLLPIVIVLGLSPMTLKLLGISYNPVTISLSSLILGIGTEFTILVLERYIEERQGGQDNEKSIETALGSVGQAITVSGLTVIAGFTTLTFVNFPVLRSFGFVTVLDTAFALASTLTILPAIIYLLRPRKKKA